MNINDGGRMRKFRYHYFVGVPHIRFWTIVPWIRTWPSGAEFTWLFLVAARYWEVIESEEVQ